LEEQAEQEVLKIKDLYKQIRRRQQTFEGCGCKCSKCSIKTDNKSIQTKMYNHKKGQSMAIYYWAHNEMTRKKIRYADRGHEKGLEQAKEKVLYLKGLYNT
jgi:hypothetical protein